MSRIRSSIEKYQNCRDTEPQRLARAYPRLLSADLAHLRRRAIPKPSIDREEINERTERQFQRELNCLR